MSKSTTTVSINPNLVSRWRGMNKDISLSARIEQVLLNDLGDTIPLSEIEKRMSELSERLAYYEDKYTERIEIEKKEADIKHEEEISRAEALKKQKEQRLKSDVEILKKWSGYDKLINEVKDNTALLSDTRYLMGIIGLLKEDDIRMGIKQLKDTISYLL